MSALFLKLVNMSITASWLVLAVVLLRLILKKAPKFIRCALWILVGVRLILPFSLESVLSLIPSVRTVPQEIVYSASPAINSGITIVNRAINPILSQSFAPDPARSVNPMQIVTALASYIWIAGAAAMLIYCAVSYFLLRRRTREAVESEKGIFICDRIDSPFILGVIKPRIYLPCGIKESDAEYVIAHERAHLRRRDHIWKPLGFTLLSIYWFNPVIWIAYVLLCRDIELACDEKVIRESGDEIKKPYSEALINCSITRRRISACPLAFGEAGIEKRIRSVLSYKKPAFWIILLAVLISAVAAVCFLTDPKEDPHFDRQSVHTDAQGITVRIVDIEVFDPSPYIEGEWKNNGSKGIVYGEPFYIYKNEDGAWKDCNRMSSVFNLPGYGLSPGASVTKRYSLDYMQMDEPGLYRFDSHYRTDDGSSEEYNVSVEFELVDPVEGIDVRQIKATSVVANPISEYSKSFLPEMPRFRIINEKHLLLWKDDQWMACGDLQAEELTDKLWDDELKGVGWNIEDSARDIRKNNKRAWLIDSGGSEGDHFFYLLLEQKDGACYIAQGNYSEEPGCKLTNIYSVEEEAAADPETVVINSSLVYDSPPTLIVTANGQSIVAWKGAYLWNYIGQDGEKFTKSNDSSDPFANIEIIKPWCINMLSYDGPGNPQVSLSFTLDPDELTVSCIDASDPDAKPESLTVDGRSFGLKNGEYIYKIKAEWTSFANNYGSVEYAFFTGMTGYGEKEWHDGFKYDFIYDIDNDGINEYVVVTNGVTTDFFTFTVGACDEDKVAGGLEGTAFLPDYPCQISVVKQDDGYYLGIPKKGGDAVYLYKIGVDEATGRISLYCEATGEYMPYWQADLNTSGLEQTSAYSPVIDTIVGDINGDGYDESCSLSAGPTSGVLSFYISMNTLISSSNGYRSLFSPFPHSEIGFAERNGGIYLCCRDENEGEIYYLVGVDASTESITLTREDNGEIIYGTRIIPYVDSE